MITNIDDNMGRLMAALDAWKLDNQTLLIFMTDNGHPIARSIQRRHARYERHGVRGRNARAGLLSLVGRIASGGRHQTAGSAPSICFRRLRRLAGAEMPPGIQLDGRSLLPLLKNPQAEWPDRMLFVHKGRWPKGQAAASKYADCAVRNSRFRLVNNKELYDIQQDPNETRNVIDQHPEVVAAMRAAYDQWWSEVLPAMENENAAGPKVNPFKARYWQQFGGGPDEETGKAKASEE